MRPISRSVFASSFLFLSLFVPRLVHAEENEAGFKPRPGVFTITTSADTKRDAYRQGQLQARHQCKQSYRHPQMIIERMAPGRGEGGAYAYTVRFRCSEAGVNGLPIASRN